MLSDSHISTSITYFKVNLKRFLIKLLVQLSGYFLSLFSTMLSAYDKTPVIIGTEPKSEQI